MSRAAAPALAADWLGLAATPGLASMALLYATHGGSVHPLCGADDAWPLGGMSAMYALMGLFHAGPWLRMIARRRAR